jgi:hypothetical protein
MADTKFESVEKKESFEKPVFVHNIDQFSWFASGAPKKWNKSEEEYETQPFSAISFNLPYTPGDIPKEVVVVSDGLSACNIYLLIEQGETRQERLYAKKVDYDIPEIDAYELFTTKISPFLYGPVPLMGGAYLRDCLRVYNMRFSDGIIRATADVRDTDRDNQTFLIQLIDSKFDKRTHSIIRLERSRGWVPKDLEDKIGK